MKSHSIFETDELGVCEYPLWVEWLSNNFNYAWSSLKDKAEVPTYNMKVGIISVYFTGFCAFASEAFVGSLVRPRTRVSRSNGTIQTSLTKSLLDTSG